MATKTTTADTAAEQDRYLVISEQTSDGYYHQYGRITTTKYESGSGWAPYGLDDSYSDGILYSGLRARCQGTDDKRGGAREPVYGFDVSYQDQYAVDLRQARRMVKTLEKIERGLAKMTETRGYVRSWGEYCGRLAEIFGCKGIVIQKSAEAERRSGYRWDVQTVGDGVNRINGLVTAWQHASERQAGETEVAS